MFTLQKSENYRQYYRISNDHTALISLKSPYQLLESLYKSI